MKIDFTTFVITGPSTSTVSAGRRRYGHTVPFSTFWLDTTAAAADPAGFDEYGITTNCLADTFSASSGNPANKPPELCGTNSGSHSNDFLNHS